MGDQAEKLRERLRKIISQNETKRRRTSRVITVTSGKGGVGKSTFSLNFALSLIERGQKVVIIDADLGLANIDVLMGVSPKYNLAQMIDHRRSIWDIIEQGPGGVEFIAGSSGFTNLTYLDEYKLSYLFEQLNQLHGYAETIIFDTGAGLSKESLKFILSADKMILVTTPEPTAITDAYAVLKMVHSKNPEIRAQMVINRAISPKEGVQTADRISLVANQYLGFDLPMLGYIFEDSNVPKATKRQVPFLLAYPHSPASITIRQIARNYITGDRNSPDIHSGMKGFLRKMLNLIK